MSNNFDYKEFAKSLETQCVELIPSEFCTQDKDYIIQKVYDFSLMAGEALCNDDVLNIDAQSKVLIAQMIAEWAFHKSCDLIRANIPAQYRDEILQKIAFAVFEVAKQGFTQKVPQRDILNLAEYHVNKTYKECIEDLTQRHIISQADAQNTLSLSNIDEMAAKESASRKRKSFITVCSDFFFGIKVKIKNTAEKLKELAAACFSNVFIWIIISFAIALSLLFYFKPAQNILDEITKFGLSIAIAIAAFLIIFNTFVDSERKFYKKTNIIAGGICAIAAFALLSVSIYGIFAGCNFYVPCWLTITISVFLGIYSFKILIAVDIQTQLEQLEQIRKTRQNMSDPNTMYERLGVDVMEIQIGAGLLPVADPDNDGQLPAKNAALRQRLTDELGYILPSIRIRDFAQLDDNEYIIIIRGSEAASGFVYPDRYMVLAREWETKCNTIPEDAIISAAPEDKSPCYWLREQDLKNVKNITATKPADVIINHLKKIAIENVDSILTTADVLKYLELANYDEQITLVQSLRDRLPVEDIRKIFVNLIREEVSIKDVMFIVDRLNDFARFSTSPDVLSEQLRGVMARKICLKNCDRDKVLYSVTICEKYEKMLLKSIVERQQYITFNLNADFKFELIENTGNAMLKAHQIVGKQPVILCPSKIRLPLFRLLKDYIPAVVVISYEEIVSDIKTETVGEIKENI